MTILLVEDDPAVSHTVRDAFEAAGFEVEAADSAEGALEKLDKGLSLATQQVDLSSRLDTRIAMLKDEITLKREMLGIVA